MGKMVSEGSKLEIDTKQLTCHHILSQPSNCQRRELDSSAGTPHETEETVWLITSAAFT